jgi:broad specificity phosphatase PhoE
MATLLRVLLPSCLLLLPTYGLKVLPELTLQVDQATDCSADDEEPYDQALGKKHHHHDKDPFDSPYEGYFIQERASKQLPGPGGQHKDFGALKPWSDILSRLHRDRKLLFLIRHGQAWSNFLEDELGPDLWYGVVSKCGFTAGNGTEYQIFDAELTELGEHQAAALNEALRDKDVYASITGGKTARAVVSPLSRCLNTANIVLDGLDIKNYTVEELIRETLGSDTCDARRSASDPPHGKPKCGPCEYDQGLRSKFPNYTFPVEGRDKSEFGLLTDDDTLWKKHKREKQPHQVQRATDFLYTLFDNAEEQVVFVVTHSGFTRSLLLAVGREPYRPQNAEVVPVIVERRESREA